MTPITSIINLSLTEGLVSPLLKKPTLSKDNMKNYRAVSNLSFLSKILQKVEVRQLNSHKTFIKYPIIISLHIESSTQLKG